jgi:prophage tail gpP-like protein
MPASYYAENSSTKLETNGQGLQEIATAMVGPFGIAVEFAASQGAIFDRVASEPGKKVLAFLAELAKQRNLVIGNNPRGALVFRQSVAAGNPVARLQEGSAPVLSVSPFFSPQNYYSHITGIEPAIVGLPGSQFTVKNPRLEGVVRPFTFNAPDTLDADLNAAVRAKAGRMFGNMAAYSVRVDTWRDPNGVLWAPNTTLLLLAPGAMIYNEFEFEIRSIQFQKGKSKTAVLDLVIPGAFSGQIPEALPWDG